MEQLLKTKKVPFSSASPHLVDHHMVLIVGYDGRRQLRLPDLQRLVVCLSLPYALNSEKKDNDSEKSFILAQQQKSPSPNIYNTNPNLVDFWLEVTRWQDWRRRRRQAYIVSTKSLSASQPPHG